MYYETIAPTEITQNYDRLITLHDPNQPIETLLQKIKDSRAFAVSVGHPYGGAMIVNVSFTLVFHTVFFPDACHAWQSRTMAQKTWTQLKADFLAAHREYGLTTKTAQQSGVNSDNMIVIT
jgi:hypothetical protein